MFDHKWDVRFLELAKHISTWSKDPSRQIGAVAVRNRQVLATGYNGFPTHIQDTYERYDDRETKYELVVHAEMNCIYNAGKNGMSLAGSTMYVYGLPVCHECAKGIIQTAVQRVVIEDKKYTDARWINSFGKTLKLFDEAGIICNAIELSSSVDDAPHSNRQLDLGI